MRNENARAGDDQDAISRRKSRLARFAPTFRGRIAALTCCAAEAEELAESFPALLVALVSDFNTAEARQKAFDLVLEGGSLKAAAQVLDLPMWLKKIPPEAFRTPLQDLPTEAQFTAKITNFIPAKSVVAGDWLEQISYADAACDSDFALWVAKHCGSVSASRRKRLFLYMAGWAWHGTRPETIGYKLIDKPWTAKMGIRRASEELMRWRRRVDLACLLGDGIESAWLSAGSVGRYDFVPLLTLDDFMSESRAMNNCLDQYGDRLATGLIRVFSIRVDGKRIADLEVGPISSLGLPAIVQIKAANNRQAPAGSWQAAQSWLENQPLSCLQRRPGPVRSDGYQSMAFWKPYLDWLPAAHRKNFIDSIFTGHRTPAPAGLRRPEVLVDGSNAREIGVTI